MFFKGAFRFGEYESDIFLDLRHQYHFFRSTASIPIRQFLPWKYHINGTHKVEMSQNDFAFD